EYSINDILTLAFKKEGYEVRSTFDGKSGIAEIEKFIPDMILLDVMLPDIDGFEICKQISDKYLVIMITAKDNIFDKIVGLELGADDYITKPFEIKEVVVRVKALFRSLEKETHNRVDVIVTIDQGITVDVKGERVFKEDREVVLKRREWDLFSYLLTNRNHVFSREELLTNVWGYDYYGDSRTVDVHIRRLRAKLGLEKDSLIETVFGKGYVMR
ncbi:MAG: DNA-binding response regulator, partial [Clostridiales bacterium]|nr:DNA-binding response regulator [Clostridiales bacterium]